MIYHANAKINIGLRIVCKRPDGYHELETFFQEINLSDTLDITTNPDNHFVITSDDDIPNDESNLAMRAARLLKSHVGIKDVGCRLNLTKRIPVGAGLGGGSSNAATTLCALNEQWQCQLDKNQLEVLGKQLGADVPFFIRGGLALGQGTGDRLTRVSQKVLFWGLLVFPPVSISTADVYQSLNLSLTNREKITKFADFISRYTDTSAWKTVLYNDLESVVFERHPYFQNIIQVLYDNGAFFASMSGSGSALFGLFNTYSAAQAVQRQLEPYRTFLFEPVYR